MTPRTTASVAVTICLCLGLLTVTLAARQHSTLEQLDLLVDIRQELVTGHVEEPDQQKMIEAAVRAMIDSLEDPHTFYFDADEAEDFHDQVTGRYSGIGAEIKIEDDRLHIITPLEDSPAWKVGVMAGDTVLEIDGEDTTGFNLAEGQRRLLGEPDTQVTVRVRHVSGEEEEIQITRAVISIQTVRGFRRGADHRFQFFLDEANRIGYVRIRQFTEQTVEDLHTTLEHMTENDVAGLILDLRFNPGGQLQPAVAISDMFLEADQTIVSVEGRRTKKQVHQSTDQTILPPSVPIVLLANEASASASEIVTAALSDNDRALFVGTRTLGKGSVQQFKKLETGQGALKITTAYWYTPSGRMIHRRPEAEVWGVDPSDGCYVAMTWDQIKQMHDIRRRADVLLRQDSPDQRSVVTPEWIDEQLNDPQLAAAHRAILGKIRDGTWPKVGQSNADELVKATKRESLLRRRERVRDLLSQLDEELAKLDADKVNEEWPEITRSEEDFHDLDGTRLPPEILPRDATTEEASHQENPESEFASPE